MLFSSQLPPLWNRKGKNICMDTFLTNTFPYVQCVAKVGLVPTYSGARVLWNDACLSSANESAEFNTTWDNCPGLFFHHAGLQTFTPIFLIKWLKNFPSLFVSCYRKCVIKTWLVCGPRWTHLTVLHLSLLQQHCLLPAHQKSPKCEWAATT